MKVVVDAMGGDLAPAEVVRGAVLAASEYNVPIILAGRKEETSRYLKKYGAASLPIEMVDAPEVISMDEQPGVAFRKKKNSSINIGLNLVGEGLAQSFVSAGNSGAVMAGSIFILRNIPGVDRPAIATPIPTPLGKIVLIDAGANVDCKPLNLAQFALMGEVYAKSILNITNPRIAILSYGEERQKGNDLTKESGKILEILPINFIGNAEGRDLFADRADVFVCDGFVGNLVLKSLEGLAVAVGDFIKNEFRKSILAMMGYLLAKPALRRMRMKVDYSEYGGAPLLGVNGGIVICHGSSNSRAIKNAIKVAAGLHAFGLEAEIKRKVTGMAERLPLDSVSGE
jgi:glycerol-3-phosphate acyltransferase PlsX